MENTYMDFSKFYRDLNLKNSAKNPTNMPSCLNTDFCVETPQNRNDGILTMAFVDMQPLDTVYSMSDAYKSGTLFPNLDKRFWGGKCR